MTEDTPPEQAPPPQMKQRLKEGYDTIATTYNAWTARHSETRLEWLDHLLAELKHEETPLSVLELGCGAGEPVTRRLMERLPAGSHITANDISSTQIALGKAALDKANPPPGTGTTSTTSVTWHEGDMMALSFPPASLDVVAGMYSIIHLPRGEQTELLGRVASWLRPGSGLLLANFAAEDMAGVVMERWLADGGWMYWSGWGAEGTATRLREAGLEVLRADVVEDVVDAKFLWVLARKPAV